MDYRIIDKDEFTVVGKSIKTSTVNGENNRNIAAFWNESNRNGFTKELAKNCGELGLLGICIDFDNQQEKLTYLFGAEKNIDQIPSDWQERQIPSATWAVFPVNGAMPDAIQKVWERIFSEWFPSTGYQHAGGPEMEVYPTDADPSSEDYYSEIWITIKK
jgi:AraC family transcriptional regulator